MHLLEQVTKFFFFNFEKFTPSDKKKLFKKIPVVNVFENWILFRGGTDLKLLFKTLLKSICLVRDTAYRKWPIFANF